MASIPIGIEVPAGVDGDLFVGRSGVPVFGADDDGRRTIHSRATTEAARVLVLAWSASLDYEVADADAPGPQVSRVDAVDATPPGPDQRRLAEDGFSYALRHRILNIDPTTRSMVRQLEAWQWRDDELVGHEAHQLVINVWRTSEITAALGEVGFQDVQVVGGYHGGEPTGDERFVVFVARRPLQ